MPKVNKESQEVLLKDLKTKKIYYYIDEDNGIKIKSREVFKDNKKIIHYPFDKRSGNQKYNKIKKITYLGFTSLPRGFLKDCKTGFGFTKIYNPLIYKLEEKFDIKEVIVDSVSHNTIKNKILYSKDIEELLALK